MVVAPAQAAHAMPAGAGVRRAGWFAFLGGAIAWTAHLMLAYAIAEFGCVGGVGRWSFLGVGGLSWLIIAVSVVTFALAVAATIVGYRDLRDRSGLLDDPPPGTTGGGYLARAGVTLSAVLTVIIAIESVPILFFLEGC